MTQTCFATELEAAVSEVLESMCFLEPEGQTVAPLDGEVPLVTRRLGFCGAYEGNFGLRATFPAAAVIACNLLGLEQEELTEDQVGESMGEIANMICGSVLGRVETKQAFDLTSPYEDVGVPTKTEAEGHITRSFILEGGVLTTWLEIERKL